MTSLTDPARNLGNRLPADLPYPLILDHDRRIDLSRDLLPLHDKSTDLSAQPLRLHHQILLLFVEDDSRPLINLLDRLIFPLQAFELSHDLQDLVLNPLVDLLRIRHLLQRRLVLLVRLDLRQFTLKIFETRLRNFNLTLFGAPQLLQLRDLGRLPFKGLPVAVDQFLLLLEIRTDLLHGLLPSLDLH